MSFLHQFQTFVLPFTIHRFTPAMRFNFALVSSFLLASAVLADRRHAHPRHSQFLERLASRTIAALDDGNDVGYAGASVLKAHVCS